MQRKPHIFRHLLRNRPIRHIIIGYLLIFLIEGTAIYFVEPTITKFGDALWYCFVAATTIGFGDFAAVSLLGRIFTVIIYIYTVLVIAIITATTTQYFSEWVKARQDESIVKFMDDLEHLPELSKEELAAISERVKQHSKRG